MDDTPNGLGGQGGKYVKVNAGGTALEFGDGTSSDIRLKDDIEKLTNCLSRVNDVQVVNFKYNNVSGDSHKHAGFIAQDFEKVMPEVVREENGYLSLVYHEIIPLLCGAIQELDNKNEKRNTDLEKRNTDLEKRNTELEKRNTDLLERLERIEKHLGI